MNSRIYQHLGHQSHFVLGWSTPFTAVCQQCCIRRGRPSHISSRSSCCHMRHEHICAAYGNKRGTVKECLYAFSLLILSTTRIRYENSLSAWLRSKTAGTNLLLRPPRRALPLPSCCPLYHNLSAAHGQKTLVRNRLQLNWHKTFTYSIFWQVHLSENSLHQCCHIYSRSQKLLTG